MKVIEKLNIKHQLILMFILPAIGLLFFAYITINDARVVGAESKKLNDLAEFAVAAGNLVHELQKERGASSGYIGSAGTEFKQLLPDQQQLTNGKIEALNNFLADFDAETFGSAFSQDLQQAQTQLGLIQQKRQAILNLTLPIQDTLAYYTNLNANFLNLAGSLATISSNGELTNLSSAYFAFLQSKERAGIERAVLANTFGKDAFAPGMYKKYLDLVAVQKTYLDMFLFLAPENQKAFFKQTVTGPAIEETEKMRQIADQNAATGGFRVEAQHWFKMQTAKIDLLKQVEDKLSADLSDKATQIYRTSDRKVLLSSAFSLAIVLATLMVCFYFINLILKQLGVTPSRLEEVVNAIASGNLSMDLTDSGKKATGVFAAMQTMQQKLRKQIETDRRIAAEMGRIKQALDNVDAAVMVTDIDYNIIYLNKAAEATFKTAEADFRRQLPEFSAAKLLGANIDQFHAQPQEKRKLLNQLKTSFKSKLIIGGRHMDITLNPVISPEQGRIGTVIEWLDRTKEVVVEKQVESLVHSVRMGQLDQRIDDHDKTGFIQHLSVDMNQLTDTIENVFNDVGGVMKSMSKGDLTHKIANDYHGVYGQCKHDINDTLDQLCEAFKKIYQASQFIRNSAQEIAAGNNNLSQRAEQQAANLEQTAASMAQLTGTVQKNAENAQKADQLSVAAKQAAQQGGQVVNAAIAAMEDINDSSHKIGHIISVIDEIAFQTNLLALNASVEAARAGENGRGFSVVATEVRNLAQRSAQAAQESKALIQNSLEKVNSGYDLVNQTGQALTEIVKSVEQVSELITGIARASREQATGIDQVNKAVTQMDEITQQNAALAEQASAASISMSDQAIGMDKLLGFFKIDR